MEISKSYRNNCLVQDSKDVVSGQGCNVIPEAEKEPLWKAFLEKFKDPIIVILLVVLCLSFAIAVYELMALDKPASCLIESVGILVAILLATGIGFLFEYNAEKEFQILNKKKDERLVKVLRWPSKNGSRVGKNRRPQVYQIKKCDVVKGDVVILEAGDEIPADGFLLEAQSLRVDESNYTGEMYAVKSVDAESASRESTYPVNFLLRGSIVLEGNCIYQVSAVGVDTEEGKGAAILQEEEEVETPLNRQLDKLADWITKASYVIAILIVAGRILYFFTIGGGSDCEFLEIVEFVLNSIMIAVTLIVVAVPEGLPMSVTISLALSMRKMLKEKNLVRKLHACETMGATTVICTDKTGTLTRNKMKVREFKEYNVGEDLNFRDKAIALNCTAELSQTDDGNQAKTFGNITEGALLYWLYKNKREELWAEETDKGSLDSYSKTPEAVEYVNALEESVEVLERKLFTPESKYMVSTARDVETGKVYRFIKGAPEIVCEMCTEFGHAGEDTVRNDLLDFQTHGFRTLGFAYQDVTDRKDSPVFYMGTAAIHDPVRSDVREAMDTCKDAGVRVIMVTGDVAVTACEVAYESGILTEDEFAQLMQEHQNRQSGGNKNLVLSGAEFAAMSDDYVLQNVLPVLKVMCRARPEDKLRLVTLLQQRGEVVAVTGDGTNDALALKKAQVGLSMGDGTSRAKEASDITIIDNSFSSINKGILWGRSLYLNIKRFILFQMTINVCACFIVLLGAFLGIDSPLNVTQMLWVNLIMDTFAAMALSSLPPDKRVMADKPRDPSGNIIDRKMGLTILAGGGLFFVFLTFLWQMLWHTSISYGEVCELFDMDHIRLFFTGVLDNAHIKPHLSQYELGVFFTIFVMIQFWNMFNARYFRTGRSLLGDIVDLFRHPSEARNHFSSGFMLIAGVILVGQIIIVTFAGPFFAVSKLSLKDWGCILSFTSLVLIVPDLIRFICSLMKNKTEII